MVHERSWLSFCGGSRKALRDTSWVLHSYMALGHMNSDILIQVTVLTLLGGLILQTTIVSATCVWAHQDSD